MSMFTIGSGRTSELLYADVLLCVMLIYHSSLDEAGLFASIRRFIIKMFQVYSIEE